MHKYPYEYAKGVAHVADCSCDYCSKEQTCKYAYQCGDCIVESIREAKVVTGCIHFGELYKFIEERMETDGSVELDMLYNVMRELILYAQMEDDDL